MSAQLDRIVAAREALEAGELDVVVAILEDVEAALASNGEPRSLRFACPACRRRFAWPGELDRHCDISGHCDLEAAA